MPDATSTIEQQREGPVARSIEHQTAKVPSDVFLWAALGAMGVSALLQGGGRKHTSLFVGQWVPVFLMFGLYNKIVKVQGSDRFESQDEQEEFESRQRRPGQQRHEGQKGPQAGPQGQGPKEQQSQTRPAQQPPQPHPQPAR